MFILYVLAGLYFIVEIIDSCLWWFRDWDEMKKRWEAVWAVPPKPEKTIFIDDKGHVFDKNADYAVNLIHYLWFDKRTQQGLVLLDPSIYYISHDDMISKLVNFAREEPGRMSYYREIIIAYFDPKFNGLKQ